MNNDKKSQKEVSIYPTISECAKMSGLPAYYIRKLIFENKIPYILCGNRKRINYQLFLNYLESEAVKTQA